MAHRFHPFPIDFVCIFSGLRFHPFPHMYILGISAFYHDSAAALVRDGEIIAAAQEERFTRIKHDDAFPVNAINYCLQEAGITAVELDAIGFYDKPLTKFMRLVETYLAYAPVGLKSFLMAVPIWLKIKLHLPREIRKALPSYPRKRPILFAHHHESHAASAFFPSPFQEAAILTMDGVGDWTTTSFGIGRGNKIELMEHISFPHSLGLLYSAFTYYLGFKVNSGEYKVMGLAPYGNPVEAGRYADIIRKNLIDIRDDGSFRMDMSYFNYCQGLTMTNEKFDRLMGASARVAESKLTQREMDIAAGIQMVAEDVMLKVAWAVRKRTGMKNLCLAGGVALNCVGNGKIIKAGIFEKYFIQPAAGDAGGALGVALFLWYQFLGKPRTADNVHDAQKGSKLGPACSNTDIADFLKEIKAPHYYIQTEDELAERVADLLAQGKIVGWVHGRMEFGPRALGTRSILGDARNERMQSIMNLKIKFRESFRPFAPIVMEEYRKEYFDLDDPSPYMLRVGRVREARRKKLAPEQEKLFGIEKLNVPRSEIPAVTHIDYSARVQTIDKIRHPRLHLLMDKFREKTGCAVLVNTSFNIRGEPIVNTPEEAYRCFAFTDMDALVLEDHLLLKEEQPPMDGAVEYRKEFKLD